MRKYSCSWIFVIVTVLQSLSSAIPTAARLQVELEGTKLSWWLDQANTSDLATQFTVSVYSTADLSQELASERVSGHIFDLASLSLRDGTYFLQVRAFAGSERGILSEVIIYNATNEGKASRSTSFTTLVVTISTVLGGAVLVGSALFAVTMWRIRQRGRRARHSPRQTREEERPRKRLCTVQRLCVCCCTCGRSVGRLAQPGGPQLRTIQARNKNGGLFPLHVVSRDIGSCHSDLADRSNASQPLPIAPPRTEDLPYGYISPADINIPQFRKFTTSSSQPSPQKSIPQQEDYVNIEFADSAVRPKKSYDGPVSLSESIYSIPGSLTASADEDYDGTHHYLSVIQS